MLVIATVVNDMLAATAAGDVDCVSTLLVSLSPAVLNALTSKL
jgi:hypothetical protein